MTQPSVQEILVQFVERLTELQQQAGAPFYSQLAKAGADLDPPLPTSTISDKLRLRSMPDLPFVMSFVSACARHADAHGIPLPSEARDLSRWESRYWEMADRVASVHADLRLGEATGRELRQRAHLRRLAAGSKSGRADESVAEWDPFLLGVHRAMAPTRSEPVSELTPYLTRSSDRDLDAALAELDRVVLLVVTGGASTGKTRACYEALVRHCPDRALLAPVDCIELLDDIAYAAANPGCVIWLDDAETYLESAEGPEVAAALRHLVRTVRHSTVVVCSMWTEHWMTLTKVQTGSAPDRHRQSRQLLVRLATRVKMPSTLTDDEVRELPDDPRLVAAAHATAADRRVFQFLAGGRLLVARVDDPVGPNGSYGRAVLTGAMMIRRLGLRSPLSKALLRRVAEQYLDVPDPPRRWFEMGLSYATEPVRGVEALTLVSKGAYRLADYVAYTARMRWVYPDVPAPVWEAVRSADVDRADLARLAGSAERLYLFRIAAQLARAAADAGDPGAMRQLSELLTKAGHTEEAEQWMEAAADAGDANALYERATRLRLAGDPAADRMLAQATEAGSNFALMGAYSRLKDAEPRRARAYLAEAASNGHPIAVHWLAKEFLAEGDAAAVQSPLLRITTDFGKPVLTNFVMWELMSTAGGPAALEKWLTSAAMAGDEDAIETMFEYLCRTYKRDRFASWVHDMAAVGNAAAMAAHARQLREQSMRARLRFPRRRRSETTAQALFAEATEWLTRAAEAGNATAMQQLAQDLWGRDRSAAEKWLARAAETGLWDPMSELLAWWDSSGRAEESARWLKRNAERGNYHAMTAWGKTLQNAGREAEGLLWLRRARIQGHVYAMHWLSEESSRMEQYGLEPDGSVAEPW